MKACAHQARRRRLHVESLEERRLLAAQVYVDASWTGLGPGVDPDGAGPATAIGVDAFATIQAGVNGVDSGGTVRIAPGVYQESDISVNRPTTIVGDGNGVNPSAVKVVPAVADSHSGTMFSTGAHSAFIFRSSSVRLQNLTIDGNGGVGGAGSLNYRGGVVCDYTTGVPYNNLSVYTLVVTNTYRVGIYLDGGANSLSTGHMISGTTVSNVGTSDSGEAEGILLLQASGEVRGNTIHDVQIGIGTNYIDGLAYAPQVMVTGNTVSNTAVGMNLSGLADGSTVGGPSGFSNTVSLGGLATADVGIEVQHAAGQVTVTGNTINAAGGDAGLWLYFNSNPAQPVLVQGNTINAVSSVVGGKGTAVGVFLTDDPSLFSETGAGASYATITGNAINNFRTGVQVDSSQQQACVAAVAASNVFIGTGVRAVSTGGQAYINDIQPASDNPLTIALNGPVAGSGESQYVVSNAVALTGITLQATRSYTYSDGAQLRIIDNTGAGPVAGAFTGLAEGASFSIDGQSFQITYTGGTGNDVVLTAIKNWDTVGLYAPASSVFLLRDSNTTGMADVTAGFGPAGANWLPLAGDWDGDGKSTMGLYNPSTSLFYLRNSNTTGMADVTFAFGAPGACWLPVGGDWDGNGQYTVGLFNPDAALFYLRNSNTTGMADVFFGYGAAGAGWTPVAGDWDGDGATTVGLFVPGGSQFYLRNSNSTGIADVAVGFGNPGAGWQPITGDWNGNGQGTVGLYDPTTSLFYLRNTNDTGIADMTIGYGAAGASWLPLTGNWQMPGSPLQATAALANSSAPPSSLQVEAASSLVTVALARWETQGISTETLKAMAAAPVRVVDLPGAELGKYEGGVIYLDRDAAGHGWFVDPTPTMDEEFADLGTERQMHAVAPQAVDRIDLLTVVEHELGHVAGLGDLDATLDVLMAGQLPTSVRRLPGA